MLTAVLAIVTVASPAHDWRDADRHYALAQVEYAAEWWEARHPTGGLAIIVHDLGAVAIPYEPSEMAIADQLVWVGTAIPEMNATLAGLREGYDTDAAYAVLIVAGAPADWTGLACVGGPHTVIGYGRDPGALASLLVHEIGHLLGARDRAHTGCIMGPDSLTAMHLELVSDETARELGWPVPARAYVPIVWR